MAFKIQKTFGSSRCHDNTPIWGNLNWDVYQHLWAAKQNVTWLRDSKDNRGVEFRIVDIATGDVIVEGAENVVK